MTKFRKILLIISALVILLVIWIAWGNTTLTHGNSSIILADIDDPSFTVPAANLAAFISEDSFSILLAHRPEYFADYIAAGADLTLSGHAHGGQFRFP